MEKLLYECWIDAIMGDHLSALEALHEAEPEYLTEYRSEAIHQVSRKLPCLGMNSAHLAAFAGRPKILGWIKCHAPELLDLPAACGRLPCGLCLSALEALPAGTSAGLERFVETLQILGSDRLRPGLPLVLRKVAGEAWRARQGGQASAEEAYLHLLRGLLADTREAFGDEEVRKAAFDVSGLAPAWDLLRETDPSGARDEVWAESALVHALAIHPTPDARAFFEAMPASIAEHLKQCPDLLDTAWHKRDGGLARFLLDWLPSAKPGAISTAMGAHDSAVIFAALGLEGVPPALPFRYLLWTLALGRSVAAAAEAKPSPDFRLYYTPRYLWNVWSDLFPGLSADDAEGDLLAATAEAYRSLALPAAAHPRDPLRGLAGLSAGCPTALPFLVASVIAASRMETGRDVTANNYYDRLGETLGYGLSHPPAFAADTFRSLWEEAARWLPAPSQLHLPPAGFVDIPQEHVLLRAADLDRLDRYFDARGFGARAQIPPERLVASFTAWAGTRLTGAALEALRDARRQAILWQVSSELARWDGSIREGSGGVASSTRVATLALRLYPLSRPGQYEVQIGAARPDGFPDTFPNVLGTAGTALEADGAGAYYPLPISTTEAKQALARKLREGWQTHLVWEGRRLRLQAPRQVAVAFRASEEDVALVAVPALPLRAAAHLLCHEDVKGAAKCYLDEACGPSGYQQCVPSPLPGWALFRDVCVVNAHVEPPPLLAHLQPETNVEVRFEGGLRPNRTPEWLCQAPPLLRFSGDCRNLRLNGEAKTLAANGLVCLEGRVTLPGPMRIVADGFATEIRLIEPVRHERARAAASLPPTYLYPLVPGEWALLGGAPGQIATRRVTRGDGEIMLLPFTPRWIVDQSGTPRIFAACEGVEAEKSGGASPEAAARWAALIQAPFGKAFSGRIQFRAGRFSDLSQKQAEGRWQDFRQENGGESAAQAVAPPAPAVRKDSRPKNHGPKGKKRR